MTAYDDPWEWFDPEMGRQTFVTPPHIAPVITRQHIHVGTLYGALQMKKRWGKDDMRSFLSRFGVDRISQLRHEHLDGVIRDLKVCLK